MAQAQLLRALSALPLLAAAALAGLTAGLIQPLAAQQPEELDIARMRARAAARSYEAKSFARAIARRGESVRAEAEATAAAASANRPAAADPAASEQSTFDFDAMVRAASAGAKENAGARLIAFASLSMPADSLKRLVEDVGRAGGAIVFRGLPQNNTAGFTAALAKVLPQGAVQTDIGIDPRLFRAFSVESVPTYIVTATPVDLCDGLDCRTAPPPHDQIRGNVTLDYALQTFASGDGPGALAASTFRKRLEASR